MPDPRKPIVQESQRIRRRPSDPRGETAVRDAQKGAPDELDLPLEQVALPCGLERGDVRASVEHGRLPCRPVAQLPSTRLFMCSCLKIFHAAGITARLTR